MNVTYLGAMAFISMALSLLCPCLSVATPSQDAAYPAMAALDEYLIPDEARELALARSAAPAAIADAADVMVLRRTGYVTAVKGSNGFVCIVERSWAKPSNDPEFWNPKMRAPNCFNQAAAETFLPIYLMKTRLVLKGQSPVEIVSATDAAFRDKRLAALAPGAMCYMMSGEQYLSDNDKSWHPHLMFFVSGDVAQTWGANMRDSPLIAADDPEERVTVFMILADKWSNGAVPLKH